MKKRVRVAVLMGGRSSEHEISMASARSVLDALDPERYDAVTVEIGRDGRWELGSGEDGRVLDQAPAVGTRIRQGDTVTIFVGQFVEPEPTTTTTTTSSTTTTPTTTTPKQR